MTELSWHDMLADDIYESLLPDGIYETSDGGLEDDYGTVVFLCDGAVTNNGSRSSYGACAYFAGRNYFNSWQDPAEWPTNQTAELGAIYGAIGSAVNEGLHKIKVLTDSEYCVKAISVWPKQCWWNNAINGVWYKGNGDEVSNQKLIRRILGKMKEYRIVAEFQHIYREENRIADRMAKDLL